MGKQVNKKQLSAILGMTEKTLSEWQKSGMPIEIEGGRGRSNFYDTAKVIDWIVTRRLAKAGVGKSEEVSTVFDEKIENGRLKHWQANEKEMAVRESAKQLVRREALEFKLGQIITSVKSGLLNVPDRVSQRLSLTKEQKKVLDDEVKTALNSMDDLRNDEFLIGGR